MDLEKIGKFIADCRKKQKLTQAELAEKLGVTSKAVSKWECGRSLPDSSIMLDLANILGISVNDLLSGEIVEKGAYNNKVDENLVKAIKDKEIIMKTDQITYSITILLLLIWNIINFFTIKESTEAINRPEFIIMDTITLIWFTVYTYLLRNHKKK